MTLKDVRVLEVGGFITGPQASALLGDLGAIVIKVERPETGDPFRGFGGRLYSTSYCTYNWNKQSVTLDLQSPEGIEIFRTLARQADVLVENFRAGVADDLGIGFEAIHVINPKLVYCSINGFGASGPYRDRPAYDTVAQAMAGYLSLAKEPDKAWIPNPAIADVVTGIYAAYGILGALLERERTGVGRHVEVSMMDSVVAFASPHFATYNATRQLPELWTRSALSQSYAFGCADDKMLVIHMSSPEKFWTSLLTATEQTALANDSRFATYKARTANFDAISRALMPVFKQRTRDEWLARLVDYDVPCAPVNTLDEVIDDPQVRHLGSFAEIEHPSEGPVFRTRNPVHFDGARDEDLKLPPTLGEHTDIILREAGISDGKIADLRGRKIV
jgi:crotonobetainyl-CoA:carnitine CoA-transferase CaiB-like acyl-CoA transferase